MSLFSTVEGFIFPDVSDEILLQEAISSLPIDLIRRIMQYDPTLLDTFKKMLYPYKTNPSFLVNNRRRMKNLYTGLSPVMHGTLYDRLFNPYHDEYTEDYIISHYQYAMAAVWYIYHQIDPYQKNMEMKNIVIKHLTVILHEVFSTGNHIMVFDWHLGLTGVEQRKCSSLQYYVTSLIDGTMDADISYPLCDILDSLCIQINFTDAKEALRRLRRFYYINHPCCDDY